MTSNRNKHDLTKRGTFTSFLENIERVCRILIYILVLSAPAKVADAGTIIFTSVTNATAAIFTPSPKEEEHYNVLAHPPPPQIK